ncbi:MAG: cytochrome P450 [Rubrimonas sp.]
MSALFTNLLAWAAALIDTIFAVLANLFRGLVALVGLGRRAWDLRRGEGTLLSRLAPHLLTPAGQRAVFAVMRAFLPVLVIPRPLVRAYPSSATVIVTRRADVLDVLRRDQDFAVVYEPRMRELTGGANFFLGMQPGADYERDHSAMRLAMRRTDAADMIAPFVAGRAAEIVAAAGGDLDVPRDLTRPVAAEMAARYFGVPDGGALADWTTTLFWFLFNALPADPAVGARARSAAAGLREAIDAAVAARKADGADADDVLGRCLALQAAETPGMDDRGIRDNLLGLLIGAIPTLSKAATLALDELLDRPDALRVAQAAARSGDDGLMEAHVWEALRFRPHNPVIYRRALRDVRLPRSTLRGRKIPEGAMVFAATHSAMFDGLDIPDPDQFRTDRLFDAYIHWGHGMHACFGDAINRAFIPAVLKPVLAAPDLRRAGPRDDAGTPFPASLPVTFAAG